jgi:hypothetical protein
MHILICAVSSSRQPSGICRHAANLARSLAGRREVATVTLLVGEWQTQYFTQAFGLRNAKLRMVAVDISHGAFARNAWYKRRLPSVARAYGPDVVHLSFPVPLNPHRFNCPVVTSLHDLYPYDMPGNSVYLGSCSTACSCANACAAAPRLYAVLNLHSGGCGRSHRISRVPKRSVSISLSSSEVSIIKS